MNSTVFVSSNHPTVFILGNGFDLDLGYPTSYKDFVNNKNKIGEGGFPFTKKNLKDYSRLGRFLYKTTGIDRWYDLENILAEYGKQRDDSFYANILGVRMDVGKMASTISESVLKKKELNKTKKTIKI